MDAKAEMLARIAACDIPPTVAARESASPSSEDRETVVARFAEHAAEYRARLVRIDREDLARAVGEALEGRTLIPPGFPTEWLSSEFEIVVDRGFDHRTLDGFLTVVTACAVAIAETGTVVLDASPDQGRRAISLIPDHHVCVVRESQIVSSVPEAVAALFPAVSAGRPLTWISGPSATSDIELTRVEGVHGPRRLDIVIVSDSD